MKSSLKIWAFLLGMVVVGIGITFLTNAYVSRQIEKIEKAEAATAAKEPAEEFLSAEIAEEGGGEAVSDAMGRAVSETLAEKAEEDMDSWQAAGMDGGVLEEEDGANKEMALAVQEDEAAEAAPVLRADKLSSASEITECPADLQEALREYRERFPQIDIQIEQIRRSETENNVYSVKTAAQTEMRIWERELEGLYRLLCDSLDEGACRKLQKEQQEWIQLRDSRAEEAAKKNSGGSLESVDYLASVAASNRERAYSLLDKYQE